MRSLYPKIDNLRTDIIQREIGSACLCEIWEKEESNFLDKKIEEPLEIHGLSYISNPRKVMKANGKMKRGGGTVIISNNRKF